MKALAFLLLIILPLFSNGQKEINQYQDDIDFKDIIELKGLIYFKADTSLVTGRVIRYNKKNIAKKYIFVFKGKPENKGWVHFKDKVELPVESGLGMLLSVPVHFLENNINYSNEDYNSLNKTESYISRQNEYTSKEYHDMEERNDVQNTLSNKRINGPYEEYYKDGQIKIKGSYKDDNLDGEWKEYYDTGQLKSKRNYKEGNLNGEWLEYYDTGQLRSKRNYNKEGNLDGEWLEYYDTGQLRSKRNYKDANLDGFWIEYDKNGRIIRID